MTVFVSAVLVHVADVEAGLSWYQRAFPSAERRRLEAFDFEYLKIGSTHLEIVPADEKVASGAAGTVVYWQVEDFDRALAQSTIWAHRSIAVRWRSRTGCGCVRSATPGAIALAFAGLAAGRKAFKG